MRIKAWNAIREDCVSMLPESFMSAKFRFIAPFAGATALVAWAIALAQALPRLMAGPLCSSRQDAWSLAGHCPACFVAAGLTVLCAMSLVLARADSSRAWLPARR
jgi:hypothetical protein